MEYCLKHLQNGALELNIRKIYRKMEVAAVGQATLINNFHI